MQSFLDLLSEYFLEIIAVLAGTGGLFKFVFMKTTNTQSGNSIKDINIKGDVNIGSTVDTTGNQTKIKKNIEDTAEAHDNASIIHLVLTNSKTEDFLNILLQQKGLNKNIKSKTYDNFDYNSPNLSNGEFEKICLDLSEGILSNLPKNAYEDAITIRNEFITQIKCRINTVVPRETLEMNQPKIHEFKEVFELITSCPSRFKRKLLTNLLFIRIYTSNSTFIPDISYKKAYEAIYYLDDESLKAFILACELPFITLYQGSLSSALEILDRRAAKYIDVIDRNKIPQFINTYKKLGLIEDFSLNKNLPNKINFFDNLIKDSYPGFCTPGLICGTENYTQALKHMRDNNISESVLEKNEVFENSLIVPISHVKAFRNVLVSTSDRPQGIPIPKELIEIFKEIMTLYSKDTKFNLLAYKNFINKISTYTYLERVRNFSNALFENYRPNKTGLIMASFPFAGIEEVTDPTDSEIISIF